MKQSMAARTQPLLGMITTAGFVRECIYDEIYGYACKVLDGTIEDERFLAFIYELDDRSEWTDFRCWEKANPGLGVIKSYDEKGERIDLDYWRENEHLALNDGLLPMIEQYWHDLADPECYVIIATARVMNEPDWQFVREIVGMPDYFISRKAGDSQSGKTLKINGLAKFFNLQNFKDAEFVFYEDNIQYLKAVCDRFGIRGVYIPSVQGH